MNFTTFLMGALALASVPLMSISAAAGEAQSAYTTVQAGGIEANYACPPGSRWEAAGYRRGKWRPEHCSVPANGR